MKSTLITHGTILTVDPSQRVIRDGAIVIEGKRISAMGSSAELAGVQADEIIDASGQIVLPGFVNAHTHCAYYVMRGRGMDRMLLDWLQELVWPWLIAMDEDDAYSASLLTYLECVKSGTTTLVDNQNYPVQSYANYDAAARAALKSGLRVTFANGFSDIQFVSPPDFVDNAEGIERECRRMIETWHGKGRLEVTVSPVNLIYCSDESIKRALQVMKDTGVAMHSHVAESRQELNAIQERFGEGYIQAFHKLGALSDRFQSVHSVWISDDEIDLLAGHGSSVMHNPTANMLLASGVAPVGKLQAAGVNVALGTDNPNNSNDMFEAMKYASLLQKVSTLEPLALPAQKVLEMATINGARALQKDDQIGSLEVGKLADLIMVDTRKPHNTPLHDPVSTLVYSARGDDVTNVMVEGEFLIRDGNATFVDEQKLVYQVQERADILASRTTSTA